MTNIPNDKAIIAQIALRQVPPMIRETLLEDVGFREKYGLAYDAVISFNNSSISFKRSKLYNAARKCLSGVLKLDLSDNQGQKWDLKVISKEEDIPSLELSSGKQYLILPYLAVLSPDKNIRLRYLNEVVSDVNLPRSTQEEWQSVLSERPLKDDEVDAFYQDYHDTPVEQAKFIYSNIVEGKITVSSLIPTSRRYFERLIGVFDGSSSIYDYAANRGRALFEQLSMWRLYDGFLFSLLLSSHPALIAEINVDQLNSQALVCAFDFLEKHGDRISQLGAIEVGLRVVSLRPEIEPVLISLIRQIRDDDIEGSDSGFKLISALFTLVDGELSRIRMFTSEPPFYRRLAALSQAALISRQLLNSDIDINSFCNWVLNSREGQFYKGQFYIQTLVDMRVEPCWVPDLVVASKIKAYFLNRILIAANNYKQSIKGGELTDLIFGTSSESIHSLCKFPYSCYPGPLEGDENTPTILPIEFSETIEKQLCTEKVTAKSFIALVNSAMIFRIGTDLSELAAKALKSEDYRITGIEDRSQLLNILNGLAIVAAVTRSNLLADELRILVRRYRRDLQYALSIEEVIRICLVAASSRKNLIEWRNFVGEWLTELAFSDLEGNDGEVLYSCLQCLCSVVPEIWVSCGRADAALVAYNGRIC